MKIINKGNEHNSVVAKPKKHKDFNPVIVHYIGLVLVSLSLIVWAIFNINWSQVKAKIDYETSG